MSNKANITDFAVGIQFAVGLSALGETAEQIRQALTQPNNTLSEKAGLIPEKKGLGGGI